MIFENSSHPAAPAPRSHKVHASLFGVLCALILLASVFFPAAKAFPQATPSGPEMRLEADQQRKEGNSYIADGNVQMRYENKLLRADHAEYNTATGQVQLRGHVRFDMDMQHVEAEEGTYDVKKSSGTFTATRGTVTSPRRPNTAVLLSDNPVYFEAQEARRLDEQTYQLRSVWLTVCLPERPMWKFFAPVATLHVNDHIALINANFRMLRIPLFYTPYARVPVGPKVRQSGFTVPDLIHSSSKGLIVGDSFYWAPNDWMDAELGAELYNSIGWAQDADVRAKPAENFDITYHYFGVRSNGNSAPGGRPPLETGHQSRFFTQSTLPGGWRAIADINTLTSLTFRLQFATTYNTATATEQLSTGFLTNNFSGFSVNFAAQSYREFLSAAPGDIVKIRKAPEIRFGSVEQQPWQKLPFYFGLDAFSGGVHRTDPLVNTPSAVERSQFAPRVTFPLHFGNWFGLTSSLTGRATHYGAQLLPGSAAQEGIVSGQNITRTTAELNSQVEIPVIERTWDRSGTRWKHSVEPEISYHFVTGVDDFSHFIRFDQYDTITNTNDIQYGVIQRLFRKRTTGAPAQLLSWRIEQKYYIDPTFGGAIVAGQRNVFAAMTDITPFAFASGPRRFSPIVSDFKFSPSRLDLSLIANYDPISRNLNALGTSVAINAYRSSFLSFSRFQVRSPLQTKFDQFSMRAGWGQNTRKGLNFAGSLAYDVRLKIVQYQAVQASYNGNCCGISFEYRRLALGPVHAENQFRVALLIANFGSFGTLRRQESVF